MYGYNAFNVYCRELAPGTVSLTGDRAQGDDSKHWAYSPVLMEGHAQTVLVVIAAAVLVQGILELPAL